MIDLPIIIVILVMLLGLLALGVPIAAVLFVAGTLGITYLVGWDVALMVLKHIPYDWISSWSLSSLPMYILMGYIAYEIGLAEKIYNFVRFSIGNLPGAIAVTTSFGCAAFGAVCGSGGATTATFAKLAYPEMSRDKYDQGLSTGVIASAGTIGGLMPPSILMIIYATLAEISVGKCFIAGIIPAILSAVIYSIMIIVRVKLKPSLAPIPLMIKRTPKLLFKGLIGLWDVLVLVFIIFGGIYSGIATATEAGALSAFAALIIGFTTHRLSWQKLKSSLWSTAKTCGMVLIVAGGAQVFARFLAYGGVHEWLAVAFANLTIVQFIAVMFLTYLIMGMFITPIGMMLLTIPVLLPAIEALGINLVWWCIIVIKMTELSCITPPVGLTVYTVKAVLKQVVRIETIFRGVFWFAIMDILTFLILATWPEMSLILPNLMMGE
ncbi:TRAP transporter large permease [Chloroflexota bacterium]